MVKATRLLLIVCLILCLSFQLTYLIPDTNSDRSISSDDRRDVSLPGQSHHAPIRIQSDSEFASVAAVEGWIGNGSSNNPYIIEDYIIRSYVPEYPAEAEHAIHISNTQSYFVVRNCQFFNDTDSEEYWTGIGILLDHVENCIINSSYFEGLDESIDLDYCTDVEIINCTFALHWQSAISAAYCENATVVNNTISGGGIGLWNSVFCNVSINTVETSISISRCDQCTIVDNILEVGGISVFSDTYYSNTIIGNTVNGLPINYYDHLVDSIVDLSGVGQVILDYCTDVVIKNGYFDTLVSCVTFQYSTNCTLRDSKFLETRFSLHNCIDCKVINVTKSGYYDSEVDFVERCVIENCTFTGRWIGFSLGHESYNCVIRNCTFYDCDEMGLSVHHAHNSTIENCVFSNCDIGIRNSIADNNTFIGNYIVDNDICGISVHSSSGCIVTENKIYDNRCGIELSAASDNIFHSNEIGWNTYQVSIVGFDSNSWDNGIDKGNYWSGYDGDGTLPLAVGSIDNFPKALLFAQGPEQVVYQNGTTGHNIEWNCTALYPVSYTIFFEGNEIESGVWGGSDISVDIDGLSPGNYTFTLSLTEIYGHTETSSVEVTVTDGSTTNTTPSQPIFLYIVIVGSAVGVVIVVIIVYKIKSQ